MRNMKKNYRRVLPLLFLSLTLSISACGKDTEAPIGQENPTERTSGMSIQINADGGRLDNVLELKGTAFGDLPVVGEEDAIYCNLPENLREWSDNILPICYDPFYGILYYVNYGRDNMIYAIKDGESCLAVPFPGSRLFCRRGKLYFLLNSDGRFAFQGAESGNILSYDPVDGEVQVVLDDVFDSIVVYQDLIFCRKEKDMVVEGRNSEAISNYFYFFDTGECIAEQQGQQGELNTHILTCHRYGEYFVADILEQADPSEWEGELKNYFENYVAAGGDPAQIRRRTVSMLCRWDGSGEVLLEGLPAVTNYKCYYAKGDDIIWMKGKTFHTYHIPTMQEETATAEGDGIAVLVNGKLYTGGGGYMDMESGAFEDCYVLSPHGGWGEISELYTDGEAVYAIMSYVGLTSLNIELFRIECVRNEGIFEDEAYDFLFYPTLPGAENDANEKR